MYRPFLFVGLGGSGGKTLRFVKKGVSEWLQQHGWDEPGLPDAWQFLHIDTPTIPDGKELNALVDMLDSSEYLGLVGDGVQYTAVSNALDNIDGMHEELVGWRVDPVSLSVPIGIGAGQFRAVGRTIAMVQGRSIRLHLKQSLDRMSTPKARSQLGALYTKSTGLTPANAFPSPTVVVVASLAGGTGAGLLINVCDLLSELGPGKDALTVLYTPEVFGAVSGAGTGVYPNSLAAVSEILNGHWLHGRQDGRGQGSQVTVEARLNRDLQHAGAARRLSKTGPAHPFLIGLKNASGSAFGTDVALFSTVGSAMVSWLTDIKVQDTITGYVHGNWEGRARSNMPTPDVLVNIGATNAEMGAPAFSALGFSRLSIGLRYFEEYAAERLARDAATWIARAHTESDAALAVIQQEGVREPDAIAARIAEKELYWFLKSAGLSEQGPDQNDVIDAIRPDSSLLASQARDSAYRLADINSGGVASASTWEQRINDAVLVASKDYANGFLSATHVKVAEWVEAAPHRTLATVEETIARLGLKVAAALVRAAAGQMLDPDGVVAELKGENELLLYKEWSSEWRWQQAVSGRLQSLGAKVENNHAALPEAVDDALHYAFFVGEAQVREQAAAVLTSFAESFLRPLAAELEGQASLLDQALQGDPANWTPWVSGPPAARLVPPPNEVTLLDPNKFSVIFDELLGESFHGKSASQQRSEVRLQVATGSFLRDEALNTGHQLRELPALEVKAEWWPGTTVVPGDLRTQSQVVINVHVQPDELKRRASAWMRRPNSPFALMLRETLRTYLQKDPMFAGQGVTEAEYVRRRQDFIPKLQAAVSASAPLVSLDPALMGTLHPGMAQQPFANIFSQLPFKNHALEAEVRSLMISLLGTDGVVDSLITSDALATSIDISSTLARPVSPLAIESLLRPIADEWTQASHSAVSVKQFWLRRRARRLEEFIPAPQEHIIAMCRGWFTGASLGIIDRAAGQLRVGREGDSSASFPDVLLSRSPEGRDILALVLESLALAYVGVSQAGNLQPLAAYNALRDLGRVSVHADGLLEYPRISDTIAVWAQTGIAPGQIVAPLVEGSTYVERLTALQKSLRRSTATYAAEHEQLQNTWRLQPSKLGEPPLWPGIWPQMSTALNQLIETIDAAILDAQATGQPGDLL